MMFLFGGAGKAKRQSSCGARKNDPTSVIVSEATQSSSFGEMDCFVAPRLATTLCIPGLGSACLPPHRDVIAAGLGDPL